MVFKWKISRPAFHATMTGADVMHAGIEVEFETGSINEAHGIFTDGGTALHEMFGGTIMASASNLATEVGADETNEQTPAKRGRKPKDKSQPDPSTANAPEPVAIPGVNAAAAPLAPIDDGIPEALRRTADPIAPVAPPPSLPTSITAPPAAPPTGVLAGKIAAELDKRATGAADGGQALADWLATSGITVKGATYAEAVTVLRLQADEKLGPIAAALGVS
jgi:hypothetical protein